MAAMIQFDNIVKNFPGVQALRDVSFSIDEGEIHALVGENGAGKSTLMNILGGLFPPNSGTVRFMGQEVEIANEQKSLSMGIGIVYQELKLCENLSITENIFLGREIRKGKKLDWKEMQQQSSEALLSFGLALPPETLVRKLSIAEQQIVEIAKAISRDIKVLILDEPTSALTLKESEKLFLNIRKLQKEGVTIIYISHRLEEVLELGDRLTVLRDGEFKGTFSASSIHIDDLVALIAGEKLISTLGNDVQENTPSQEKKSLLLEVGTLKSEDGRVQNVSFNLHKGEILGIYGVQGAGRTELLETLFGLRKKKSGSVVLNGSSIHNASPARAIENGFAMVPEDRRQVGIFPNMNIIENINMTNKKDVSGVIGFLRKKQMVKISKRLQKEIGIKAHSLYEGITKLSGGNQQKVVISRWLATNPKVLLVDELTRGVDVGAKAEIFSILKMLRNSGLGIVMVSSEIQEVIAESDRVLVMKNGTVVKELVGVNINKDAIIRYSLVD